MKKTLRNKDVKELKQKIFHEFNTDIIDKKDKVEIGDDKIFVNDTLNFFYLDGRLIPSLKILLENQFLAKVVVDMGAVKFVVNGADIMRPGIVEMDDFSKDDLVCVVDVNNKKPLAVGVAMFSSDDMKAMNSGKVIKNIHYVGDEIWES